MYEELRGYDSIDALLAEKREEIRQGLNELPQYPELVKEMARMVKGRGVKGIYKVGVFVDCGERISGYFSNNEAETGKILSIERCLDLGVPDFAIRAKEQKLLYVIDKAEDIRDKFDKGDFLEVLRYVNFGDVWPGRKEDGLNFVRFILLLGGLLGRDKIRKVFGRRQDNS